ncbi:MAG: lytic transglycosylase domain-containing protein [Anaerocolumna sp.]
MSEINGIKRVLSTESTNAVQNKNSVTSTTSFSSYLGENQTLDQIFLKASEKYDVPVNLLKAIGKAESNFDTDVVSRSGAQGVMQLMPATAKYLGVTDAFDPEQNIMGGAKYIKELLDKYDGNTSLALAAYNAGMGNVSKYGGIPPFEETQNYVKKVTAYMNEDIDTGSTTYAVNATYSSNSSLPNILQIKNNLINQGETKESDSYDLSSLFTYDDYLKFLEIFYEDNNTNKTEENNYFSKAISYNASVMNLFK